MRAIIRLGLAHVVFLVTWEQSHLMWDGCPVSHSTFTFICTDEDVLVLCFTLSLRSIFGLPFFRDSLAFLLSAGSQPFAFFGVCSCRNCTAYGRRLTSRLRYCNSLYFNPSGTIMDRGNFAFLHSYLSQSLGKRPLSFFYAIVYPSRRETSLYMLQFVHNCAIHVHVCNWS